MKSHVTLDPYRKFLHGIVWNHMVPWAKPVEKAHGPPYTSKSASQKWNAKEWKVSKVKHSLEM